MTFSMQLSKTYKNLPWLDIYKNIYMQQLRLTLYYTAFGMN